MWLETSSNEDWVAEPAELLSLFLTDHFWTLRTGETNRYEQQFSATQKRMKKEKIK